MIYSIAMGQLPISIGTKGTDWANDVLFGEIVPGLFDKLLLNAQGEPVVAHWLYGLIQDGIVAGVGAVLGFVPQILVLCFLLAILESVCRCRLRGKSPGGHIRLFYRHCGSGHFRYHA